jgi:hypothetical protein
MEKKVIIVSLKALGIVKTGPAGRIKGDRVKYGNKECAGIDG